MSRVCKVTGKKTTVGYKYAIRGIAKKKKGIGLKTTGKTKRRFFPNLVKKRFWFAEENRFVTINTSVAGIRNIEKLGLSAIVRQIRARGERV